MGWPARLAKVVRPGIASALFAATAPAQDAGAPQAPAAELASPAAASPADAPAAQIRALMAGALDVRASPQALFDVPLDDEAGIRVEAARLRVLVAAAAKGAGPGDGASSARAAADAGEPPPESFDSARWGERLELDRARLQFYSQSAERRAEQLRQHRARRSAARPGEAEEARRAREAEEERARVLEAAKAARTEAERLVKEELARLIALESSIRATRAGLATSREQIGLRRDSVIGWQRRIRNSKAAGPEQTDATYDALRRALGASREALSSALSALGDPSTDVPALGPDPLVDVPPDVPADSVRERRTAVASAISAALEDERSLRAERAAALLDEISVLNRERLGLLPYLSAGKRAAITGFTSAGWEQARAEAWHLSLILRYHQHVAQAWLGTLRDGGKDASSSWKAAAVVLPLLLAGAAFGWARRKTLPVLKLVDTQLAAADRAERRTSASLGRRVVRVLHQVHRPLEWLVFCFFMFWLLPSAARGLLEVQLLASAIGYTLAGALVVNTINALAAEGGVAGSATDAEHTGRLRLRSLRLVGRTVVAFALVLVLTGRLVGEGTIHSWALSACWFAGIPVFLLLVRWWRGTVFERLDRLRKKTALQAWILANRSGWKSFLAALLGAVQLFGAGAIKLMRSWLSGFDLARRVHAYLFKREIERIGQEHVRGELDGLSEQSLEQLHPERPFERWLPCPGEVLLAALLRRAAARQGALVAIVGARGMGKSSLFRAAAARAPDATLVPCQSEMSLADLREAIGWRSSGSPGPAARGTLPGLVLIDDAHALVNPCIGGLTRFDELIAFARGHAQAVTWVFGIDAALWPLLERARDARPMFDETHILTGWNEAQIGALLRDRCDAAGLAPTYDDLLDELPPGSDEVDRQDALAAKKVGYERMLWDHVDGNPALALEVWRASLARDQRGVVHVRPLRVPDVAKLERLPDASLFVLRAVLQLSPTTADAVARATRLGVDEVLQELRFGQAQGFFDEHSGRTRVAWPWLRAVTRVLERRHLLVKP